MSVLVQYLNFLKSSRGENEKNQKLANESLPGYEPSMSGVMSNDAKDPGDLSSPITDNSLTSKETPKNINTASIKPVGMASSASAATPAFTQPVSNPGRGYNRGVPAPQHIAVFSKIPRVLNSVPKANEKTDPRAGTLLAKVGCSLLEARNTGIVDSDNSVFVNCEDKVLLGKLGFDVANYLQLEKTSEVLDLYSYIEKVAGIPKSVVRAIDKGEAFSGSFLEDMNYDVPKGYEVKGDLCCPVEKTALAEKESFEKTSAADPSKTILVTGHSGAGKTTLAQALAEKLGLPLQSVDKHPEFKEYVTKDHEHWEKSLTPGTKEHKIYTDLVHKANQHTLDNSPAAAIIEGAQLGHMSPEELAKYKAHIVVGGDPGQSIAQRIARSAKKKGVVFSPEEILEKQNKARAVVKFWEPGIEKFKKLPGVIHYNHTEHQIEPLIKKLQGLLKNAAERPGLWANIHAKKARGEKAAKPGDAAYPDKKQWDKLSKESAVAAWQRSEGKNPEGGLNAKGRASYKRETGGTLKAPVTEKDPSGERAKRQNSFCSRMCGMKRENTGSEGQSDPDSRINKSLRKWNCKCGEDHGSLYEKVACMVKTAEMEKEASPVSRKIMDILRKANPAKRTVLLDKLRRYGAANEVGLGFQRMAQPQYIVPLSPRAAEKAKVMSDKLNMDVSIPHNIRDRYRTAHRIQPPSNLSELIEQRLVKRNPTTAISEKEISTFFENNPGGKSKQLSHQLEGQSLPEIRKSVRHRLSDKRPDNLLMQLPMEQKGVEELLFTPQMGKTDPSVRRELLEKYKDNYTKMQQNIKPEEHYSRVEPLYETVISRHNIKDPGSRLTGGKYYIPSNENVVGALPAHTLPNASEGYMYKGSNSLGLKYTKPLNKVQNTAGTFFSGNPAAAASYAVGGTNGAEYLDPRVAQYFTPAGYAELRKYLSPARSKINQASKSIHDYITPKIAAADHPLTSSNIKAVGYDKKNRTLEVAFHSGGEYKYKGVPKSVFNRIKRVKSPGKFFHKHIKKDEKFPYEKQGE